MGELQKAIEEITCMSRKFPAKAFETIGKNKEEAIPYLRKAIEKALEEKDELDDSYQLHFYALYLLGEFEDREFFPKIIELASLPGEILDYLIGDTITTGLKDIVYHTYNGDLKLLKNAVVNEEADEYARAGLLEVMGQLYQDGTLEEQEWKSFIKECVYSGEEFSYFYNGLGRVICQCHFVDMLPEIRYMAEQELIDEYDVGEYSAYVDYMFEYKEYEKRFCESALDAADTLRGWAMFEQEDGPLKSKKRAEAYKKLKQEARKESMQEKTPKIGRNDPCPCGSGKKYKFCCLNKPKSPIDSIESLQERTKALEYYPCLENEKQERRIYLADYFDQESIEIDKLLYLGLMPRPGWIWLKDEKAEEDRCRKYLSLAFPMFMDKAEKEEVKTFKEYDQKYSIHYFCEDWIEVLLRLLKKNGDKALYAQVVKCRKKMG